MVKKRVKGRDRTDLNGKDEGLLGGNYLVCTDFEVRVGEGEDLERWILSTSISLLRILSWVFSSLVFPLDQLSLYILFYLPRTAVCFTIDFSE